MVIVSFKKIIRLNNIVFYGIYKNDGYTAHE